MFHLDTNVIIDAIRGKYPHLVACFEKNNSSDIAISTVVVAELEFGAAHSDNYEKRRKQYLDFIAPYKIIPFTEKEAVVYGQIREQLTRKGTAIGPNDLLIAAIAIANGATLVTHNTNEFSRLHGLSLVDWRSEE